MDKIAFTHEEELDSSTLGEKFIVNHVMSRSIDSGIFNAILGYFNQFGSTEFEHVPSTVSYKTGVIKINKHQLVAPISLKLNSLTNLEFNN